MEKPYRNGFLKCNNIAKIWYGLAVILLQIYVHYEEIENYVEFKKQANDPRYGLQWNEKPATFCLMITLTSLAILPFFLYSSLIRTGNLVNDFVSLGENDLSKMLQPRSLVFRRLDQAVNRSNQSSCWQILRYYSIPSCQSLHYLSAFLLLLPLGLLNAEKVKNSAICSDYLWISDLHSILNIKDQNTIFLICQESEYLRFPIGSLNFIIASIFLSIHSSSVFWKTSKSFSFLIAMFDVIMSFCYLLLNSALSIAFRYYSWTFLNGDTHASLYSKWRCCTLLLIGFLCFLVCRNLIFEFGLQRYVVNQRSLNQMLEDIRVPSISTGLLRNSREFKDRIRNQFQSFWLNALGFMLWIVEAGCLIPLACYMVTTYWHVSRLFFILGFMAVTSILITMFSIWMLLSIKNNWVFKVGSSTNVCKNENQPPEPIYTCFHDKKILSHPSLNAERKSSFSKLDNNCGGYLEDATWGNSDLYQLFKIPSEFINGRIPSVTSIPSHFVSEQIHPTYQTIGRQQNMNKLLNEIEEDRLLDERSRRDENLFKESLMSPALKIHRNNLGIMTPKNVLLLNNSQSDSAYQSCRQKNYSQDSLRSVTFANRRNNMYDVSDFSRADNVPRNCHFETGSHNGVFPSKDNIPDDNTDISTDFSDQNTTSSGTDGKSSHKNRYHPASYHYANRARNPHNEEIYLQQTGV